MSLSQVQPSPVPVSEDVEDGDGEGPIGMGGGQDTTFDRGPFSNFDAAVAVGSGVDAHARAALSSPGDVGTEMGVISTPTPAMTMVHFTQSPPLGHTPFTQLPMRKTHRKRASAMRLSSDTTSTLPEYQRYQVIGLGIQGLQRKEVGVVGRGGGGGVQDRNGEEDEESDRPPDYPDSAEEADEDTDEEGSLTGGFGGGELLSDRENRFSVLGIGPQSHAHELLGYQRQQPRAHTHTSANLAGINAPQLPNPVHPQPYFGLTSSSQDQLPDLDLDLKGRSSHVAVGGITGGEFDVGVVHTTTTTPLPPTGVGGPSSPSPRRVKRYQHYPHPSSHRSHSHSHSISHTNSNANSQHHCHHCTHTTYLPHHYPQQQQYQEHYQHYQHLPQHHQQPSHFSHLNQHPHPYQHGHNLHHLHSPHKRKSASVSLGGFHSATATSFASSSTSGYNQLPHLRKNRTGTPPPNTPSYPSFNSHSNSGLNLGSGSHPKLGLGLPAGEQANDEEDTSTDPYLDSLLERSVHALEMSNTLLKSTMKTQTSLSTISAPDYRDDDDVSVGVEMSAKRHMKKRSGSMGHSKKRIGSVSSATSAISAGSSSKYRMVDERRAIGYSERIREKVKERDESWMNGLEEIRKGVEGLFDDEADGESASNRAFVMGVGGGHRLEGSFSSSLPSASMMEEYRFGRIQEDLPYPGDKQSRRTSLDFGFGHQRDLSSSTRSSNSKMTHKSSLSTSSGGSASTSALRYTPHRRSTLVAPAPRALTQYVVSSTDPNEISLPSTLGLRSTSSSHWAPSTPPEFTSTPLPTVTPLPPILPTLTPLPPPISPYLSRPGSAYRHALASASTPNLSMTLNVKRTRSPLEPRVTTLTTDSTKVATTPAIHMLSNLVQRVGVGAIASASMAVLPKVTLTPPRKEPMADGGSQKKGDTSPGLAGMFTTRNVSLSSPEAAAKKAISSLGESINSASSILVQSFGRLKRASSLNLRGEAVQRSVSVGLPAPSSGEERGRGRKGRSASLGGVKRVHDHAKPVLNTLDTNTTGSSTTRLPSTPPRKSPGSYTTPGPSSGVTPSPSSSCSCSRNGTPKQAFTSLPPSTLPSTSALPADINFANIHDGPSQTQTQIFVHSHHHHHHSHHQSHNHLHRMGTVTITGYRPMTPPMEAEMEESSSSSSDGCRAKLTVVSLRKILDEQPPPPSRSAGSSVNEDGRKTMKAPAFMPRSPAPLAESGTSTATASISRLFTKGVHSSSTRPPSPPRQSAMKRSFSGGSVGAASGIGLAASTNAGGGGSGSGTPGSVDSRPISPNGLGSALFPLMMGSRSNSGSGRSTPKRISFAELPESYASTKPEGSTSKFNEKKNGGKKRRKRSVDGKGKGKGRAAGEEEGGSDADGLGWWASLLGGGGGGIGFGLGGSGFVGVEDRYSGGGGSSRPNGSNMRSWNAGGAGRMGMDDWAV